MLVLGTARPFQVAAGRSMSPTLETGDFVVLQGVAPEDLHVGDIVAIAVPPEAQSK
ncbi:MAG: S26 family signal peptidase [Actinobacteria bacterium]|nr:S26 family signal peptidase [Actinomycetota bacterium]